MKALNIGRLRAFIYLPDSGNSRYFNSLHNIIFY